MLNSISTLLPTATPLPSNPRRRILKLLLDELHKEECKVSDKVVCIRLGHLSVADLEWIFGEAKDYRNRTGKPFGQALFGMIKKRK